MAGLDSLVPVIVTEAHDRAFDASPEFQRKRIAFVVDHACFGLEITITGRTIRADGEFPQKRRDLNEVSANPSEQQSSATAMDLEGRPRR